MCKSLKKGQNYGVRKPLKGNTKFAKRQISLIKPEVTHNKLNSTQIKNNLNLLGTFKHVAYIRQKNENIKWQKLKCKPMLKKTA